MNVTNDLIKIEKRQGIETVNSRELHEFLDVGRDYSSWIKQRIEKYGFSLNQDYVVLKSIPQNGGSVIDYHITIDMAKELSMVENNSKGREARQYFILMEKKAKNVAAPQLTEDEMILKTFQILNKKVEMLSIKAQVAEEIANTEGLYLPSIAGKMIDGHANKFCQWLVDNNIMFRRKEKLIPYAPYDKKYFDIKVSVFGNKSVAQSYFTTRGLMWIQTIYLKKNNRLLLDYSEGK